MEALLQRGKQHIEIGRTDLDRKQELLPANHMSNTVITNKLVMFVDQEICRIAKLDDHSIRASGRSSPNCILNKIHVRLHNP
jgi:hypothetical protein